MQNSIKSLGLSPDKNKDKADAPTLMLTMSGLDYIKAQVEKAIDDGALIKPGMKPVARDGHTATMLGQKMFVFAGDRHKMSFNDLFALNLKPFENIQI